MQPDGADWLCEDSHVDSEAEGAQTADLWINKHFVFFSLHWFLCCPASAGSQASAHRRKTVCALTVLKGLITNWEDEETKVQPLMMFTMRMISPSELRDADPSTRAEPVNTVVLFLHAERPNTQPSVLL